MRSSFQGFTARQTDGRVVVSHLVNNDAKIEADPQSGRLTVKTFLCYRKHKLPTPLTNIIFRLAMITVGRFNANAVRSTLQKILITGKPSTGHEVTRTIEFKPDRVSIDDRVPAATPLTDIAIGADSTSIYVANSNVYQESVLCPWLQRTFSSLPQQGPDRLWHRDYFRGSGHDPHGPHEAQA